MNTKLHAVTDTIGRPIRFFMTAGQVSDYFGALVFGERVDMTTIVGVGLIISAGKYSFERERTKGRQANI